jgi:hypothetical protein
MGLDYKFQIHNVENYFCYAIMSGACPTKRLKYSHLLLTYKTNTIRDLSNQCVKNVGFSHASELTPQRNSTLFLRLLLK